VDFHQIVTGIVGIGKTTVCRRLIELVCWHGHNCGGILADTASGETIIIEDIQTGEKETLAGTKQVYPGPYTPRYSFSPKDIDFGIWVVDKGGSDRNSRG
jgi:nucleoside-triphosphatase THEP1